MNEDREHPDQEPIPTDPYKRVLQQIRRIGEKYNMNSISNPKDETFIAYGTFDSFTFVFETKHYNTTTQSVMTNEFKNEFTFTFNNDEMKYSYLEVLPPRDVSITFQRKNYEDTQAFMNDINNYLQQLNGLLKFFDVDDQIEIPE